MTRRPLCHMLMILLCTALAACGGGGAGGKGSTAVTISIGAAGHAAGARARLAGANKAPALATLLFTISAPDMQTISQSISFTPPQATVSFDVPNGTGRLFLVEARDAGGVTIYQGSANTDLTGQPVTINILMNPLFFLGTRLLGTAQDDFGFGMARDGAGNIYIAGLTHGDFSNLLSTGVSITGNAFLSKFDQYGQPVWTRQFGTDQGTLATGVAVDGAGNIVVVGGTGGDLDGQPNHGFLDGFIVKFDPSGSHLWTRLIGDIGDDEVNAVSVDASGNVYVTGFISGTAAVASTGLDVFAAKFDPSGSQQWIQQYGTTGSDTGEAVAADANGNVYVAGTTDGGIDNNTNAGISDAFLSKLDPQGLGRTTRQFGSSDIDQAASIGIDAAGFIYVAGTTYGNLNGISNSDQTGTTSDIFVAKFDASLALQSTALAGTPRVDISVVTSTGTSTVTTGNDIAHGMAIDSAGNVIVTGSTNGVLPGNTNAGGYDIGVVKFSSSGTVVWARQTGTPADDDGNAAAVDGSGNVFVTGTTKGLFDGLQSSGFDAFLVMFDKNGVKQ